MEIRIHLHTVLALVCAAALAAAQHTNNWAVLVGTSRFWFNYRHQANTLSMYHTVKRLGIPDSNIILMLPDDMACNPRNSFPGTVYNNNNRQLDLYGDNIEVDYRGYEVTVENFIRLMTDRVDENMPRSKRLLTDDRSNIFVYMTGHGGNEFLKFQDAEEISAFDIADAFAQMHEKKRYHEILFMIDTCQANTMYTKFRSPDIVATGSSELDESSYSHHADQDIGVAVIDRYTYFNLEYLENQVTNQTSKLSLGDLFDSYDEAKIHSQPGIRYDLVTGGADAARSKSLMDFFGAQAKVQLDAQDQQSSLSISDINALAEAMPNMTEAKVGVARATVQSGNPQAPAGLQRTNSSRVLLFGILSAAIGLALLVPVAVWAGISTTPQPSAAGEPQSTAPVRLAREAEKKPVEIMIGSSGLSRA
ncbi:hypothetical protein FH972_023515 [Carpinus fangiana]|uniref:GPI-anchor transamidase n=1 Tax=Carpinus fangiana TaxID=176857 RepID=A0A5N6KVX3_9ROSI|nr:hypothetical protein FH972_023515 [Carpinus fangiana]